MTHQAVRSLGMVVVVVALLASACSTAQRDVQPPGAQPGNQTAGQPTGLPMPTGQDSDPPSSAAPPSSSAPATPETESTPSAPAVVEAPPQRIVRAMPELHRIPPPPERVNPLAEGPWGVYQGRGDQAWAPYEASRGRQRELLAKIALRPKAKWFGAWIPDDKIQSTVVDYVANSQAGDPDALVQMAVFRMVPWEHEACRRLPSAAEQASYRTWIDRFAAGVGDARVAIILQPDGPFARCAPGGSPIPSELIAYSARVLGALPRASVYLDAGAADWPAPGQGGVEEALAFLVPGGVEHLRGIALNSTHYSDTNLEVERGAQIVEALAARGIKDKTVVINTSSSGNPFEFGKYTGKDPDDAFVCESPQDTGRTCVTLGIPPTAAVSDPRWGLTEETRARAEKYVDAYLWFGRPWLYRQNDPFVMERALKLVESTPY